jgi:uncharacterized integral membrane protein
MSSNETTKRFGGLTARQIIGIVIALISLVLIGVNWQQTEVSLLVATVTMPLTILLALVFLGGMATGAMVLRRRQARTRG